MYKVKIDNPLSEEFDAIGMYNNPVIYNLDNSNLLNSNEIIISDMFAATYIYDRFVENKKDYLEAEKFFKKASIIAPLSESSKVKWNFCLKKLKEE